MLKFQTRVKLPYNYKTLISLRNNVVFKQQFFKNIRIYQFKFKMDQIEIEVELNFSGVSNSKL